MQEPEHAELLIKLLLLLLPETFSHVAASQFSFEHLKPEGHMFRERLKEIHYITHTLTAAE